MRNRQFDLTAIVRYGNILISVEVENTTLVLNLDN